MFDEPELAAAHTVRAAWRADEEVWARAALVRWEHERALVDVLRDCMHRGDTVAFGFATCTFTGVLTAVGRDLARVTTPAGGVDVRVDATMPARRPRGASGAGWGCTRRRRREHVRGPAAPARGHDGAPRCRRR